MKKKPNIRYKYKGKRWVLSPDHPMYNVIEWYGEYKVLKDKTLDRLTEY